MNVGAANETVLASVEEEMAVEATITEGATVMVTTPPTFSVTIGPTPAVMVTVATEAIAIVPYDMSTPKQEHAVERRNDPRSERDESAATVSQVLPERLAMALLGT